MMDDKNYFSGMLRKIAETAATVDDDGDGLSATISTATAQSAQSAKRVCPLVLKEQCADYNKKLLNLENKIQNIKSMMEKSIEHTIESVVNPTIKEQPPSPKPQQENVSSSVQIPKKTRKRRAAPLNQ